MLFKINDNMRKTIITLIVFQMCFAVLSFGSSNTTENNPLAIKNLQEYLSAKYQADGSLLVYFNYTQEEFDQYVELFDVEELKVEIYGHFADASLDTTLIDSKLIFPSVNIETWAMVLTEGQLDNYELLYALNHINGVACTEGIELIPNPYVMIDPPECGMDSVYTVDASSPPSNIELNKTYTINGFPFEAISQTQGRLSLPFGNQVVLVDFNNIQVNAAGQVTAGSVSAVADNGANYTLDRYVKRLKNGNSTDICIPPPPPPGYDENGINTVTGLDDWGFDENGIHEETGTQYDKHGFDSEGNHMDTATPFNEDGCSREGLDAQGNECQLMTGTNPAAEDYLAQNAETISNTINQTLTSCTDELTAQITAQTAACQVIRSRMVDIVTDNTLPAELIFGQGGKYLDEGMSAEFTSAPKAIGQFVERNAEVVELEQKHVDLYYCDLELTQLKEELNNAEEIPADYESQINEAITTWTEYEYELYTNDQVKFEEWVKQQIESLAAPADETDEANLVQGDQNEDTETLSEDILRQKVSEVFAYKNNAFGVEQPVYISEKKGAGDLTALLQQYDKGLKSIDGVDRVYYTRQIFDKKLKSNNEDMHNVMPLKLTNPMSDKPYDIYIERIEIGLNGASLDAVILIEDTKNGGHIVFRGENIGFGTGGLSGGEDSYLRLDSEVGIRLNNAAKLHLLPDSTYVRWDCNGFQAIGIGAEIEFCPEFIKPVIGNVVSDTENYRLTVVASEVANWNDFHFSVNAPPFVLTKYETVIWQLDALVVDFSTTKTEPTQTLPGYESSFSDASGNLTNEWEGFYIQNLRATIPKDFTGEITENTEIFEVSVDLAIIDDGGFTGQGSVTADLVSIDDGNLNGWAFSINQFYLRVVNNHFAGTGFGGDIQLPIIEDPMPYTAEVFPGDKYKFAVEPITNSESQLFKATLNIDNSLVVIGKDQSGFHTFADLTGSLDFNPDAGDGSDFAGFSLPSLKFSNFQISNQAPYFSPGIWQMDGDGIGAKLGGFKIELDNIKPYQPQAENTVGLGFNLAVILNEGLNISAKGGLGIVGILSDDGAGRQKWVYDDLELHSLFVDAPIGSLAHVKGGIAFEKGNPQWGDYFQGALEVELKKVVKTKVTGVGQFGNVNDNKYFYVDAMVNLPTPLQVGPISFTALGLGVYKNVNYSTDNVTISDMLAVVNQDVFSILPSPGASLSGGEYSYDPNIALGIKGLGQFKTGSEELMNGTVAIGSEFSTGGGLNKLYMNGAAQFLATLDHNITADLGVLGDISPASVTVPMSAYVDLKMDFSSKTFTGDIAAYLDTPLLRGAGNNYSIIDGKIHFSPDEWYIKIGSPTNRAGLLLTLPNVDIGATGYFQVGTNTDPMADIPSEVREIAYSASRNQSLLRSGQGLIFGAKLDVQGGINLAGFASAELRALAGFDLMLRRYVGLSCAGQSGDIGINGWYASGQMYALLEGKLKVFGLSIFEAGVAAVLQAQLPNPFFAEATVGVRGKVGPFTIKKSLSIALGEACDLQADDPAAVFGADVIASITPADGEQDVAVASQPKVNMHFPLNQVFSMPSINGNEASYEIEIQSIEISSVTTGPIPSAYTVSSDGLEVNVNPIITLTPDDELSIEVNVNLYENGSLIGDQTKSVTFRTGAALEDIPISNVRYAYPYHDMENYHPKESGAQFIQLISGQPDLFDGIDVKLALSTTTGSEIELPITYNSGQNKIEFQLPDDLPSTAHRLEIVQNLASDERHIIHTINFSVSEFERFADKVADLQSNFVSNAKFQFFSFGAEGLSSYEATNIVSGDFGISISQEAAFFSQFDQFGDCDLCPLQSQAIISNAVVNEIAISPQSVFVNYENVYAQFHTSLIAAQKECIYETCGDGVEDCTNFQFVSNEKKSNTDACPVADFQELPPANYPINLTYSIPGGSTSHHQLIFTK